MSLCPSPSELQLPSGPPPTKSDRPSLRGVTSGTVFPGRVKLPVLIAIHNGNLDWLYAICSSPVFHPGVILLKNMDLDLVSEIMSALAKINLICPIQPWTDSDFADLPPCQVAVTNARVNQQFIRRCSALGCQQILSTKGFRSVPPRWSRASQPIDHSAVGGVTSTTVPIHIAYVSQLSSRKPHVPPRDVRTILQFTQDFDHYVKKPNPLPMASLTAAVIGRTPQGQPIYHGHGLLPGRPTLQTHISMSLKPGQGRRNFWGYRPLTHTELLHAYGLGDAFHPCLGATGLHPEFSPIETLQAGLESVYVPLPQTPVSPQTPPLNFTGGGLFSRNEEEEVPPLGDPFESDSDDDSDDESMPTLADRPYDSDDSDEEDPDAAAAAIAFNRDARERKAVKSDDAAVPTYLWREHLMKDPRWPSDDTILASRCQERKARVPHPKTWVEATDRLMEASRTCAFTWWQRHLRKGFHTWYFKRYPMKTLKASRLPQASVSWNAETRRYVWLPRGNAVYAKWYKALYTPSSTTSEAQHNLRCARDAITRGVNSSWWEWNKGSRPFFWRWPEEAQELARDGMKVHFLTSPPRYWNAQSKEKDPVTKDLVKAKLQKVLDRGYMDAQTDIQSLMSYFHVQKGTSDIRMVYDGTKCGLNDAVWVPSFYLPTISTHLRAVEEGTHMCDVDLGEMFLNFMMHPSLRPLAGVDLTPYGLDLSNCHPPPSSALELILVAWNRIAMGIKWSPYQAVLSLHHAEEVIKGDPKDPSNVFRWDSVRLNLPGNPHYSPGLPWVSKVIDVLNKHGDKTVAADLFTFVDDLRPTGSTAEEAWRAGRRAASIINWLGCQDAARKRRDSKQDPGAWAGCVVRTKGGVFILVSDDKWAKAKTIVAELEDLVAASPSQLDSKTLQRIRGFLNYVSQTYKEMVPYLNGLHLTIDGWRPGRDSDGWRLPAGKTSVIPPHPYPENPTSVKAATRLVDDIHALKRLTISPSPPWKRVRPRRTAAIWYGFGDASGAAFGATLKNIASPETVFEYGQWPSTVTEEASSNWRELANLVQFLVGQGAMGKLNDSEVFMFTDNSTAEAAFWKGNSKSRKLMELVIQLRELEMQSGVTLHVIHVSGKRMIAQGTDGLSRGDHSSGVMTGIDMLSYVPLHEDALKRSPPLISWLDFICQDVSPQYMTPEDWFKPTVGNRCFVWTPPPAACDAAVERLRVARHLRPNSLHLVIVPRLMTGRWRKQLGKAADCYFKLEHPTLWDMEVQFEPLLIFVCLPYLPHAPRFEARESLCSSFCGLMLAGELWRSDTSEYRDLLRELLQQAGKLRSL